MGRDERWFRRNFAAGDEGGTAVVEGQDGGYQWPEGTDPEIAGRFKDPVALAAAKREQDATITRLTTAQKESAAEREAERAELDELRAARDEAAQVWEDPLRTGLPNGVDEQTQNRLVAMFQHDPAGAFDLAREAAPGYGPQLQNDIMQAWLQRDPVAAMNHLLVSSVSPILDERFQSFEDQLVAQLGPTLAHSTEQMSAAAVELAYSQAPDMADYQDRIEAMILENPALIADAIGNTKKSSERLLQMRDLLWAQDERARVAAGAKPSEEPAKTAEKPLPARARQAVIAASDATAPDLVDDDYAKRMSLKGVRGRNRGSA